MASTRERRVAKELNDIMQDQDQSGVRAMPNDPANLTQLTGSFPGPPDTVYAGGTFKVAIEIPEQYPFKPPSMRLLTRIWHPNISSQTGAICLDTLGTGWSPVQTIKTALISLRLLLEFPNPKDPQDAEVARQYINDRGGFSHKALDWARRFADAPSGDPLDMGTFEADKREKELEGEIPDSVRYGGFPKPLVERFTTMGFQIPDVLRALNEARVYANNGTDYRLDDATSTTVIAYLLGDNR